MHTSCGWSFAPLLVACLVSHYNLLVLTQTQKCMLVKTLKHNDLEKLRIIFLLGGAFLLTFHDLKTNEKAKSKCSYFTRLASFFAFILCGIQLRNEGTAFKTTL